MPLQDELCFVQFMHPGKEHRADKDGFKDWNRGEHKRKFVEITGRCRQRSESFRGLVRFWAEWEPQSDVLQIAKPIRQGPKFVHHPYYVVPKSYRNLQNTDPFVFGGFFYVTCKQDTKRGPGQMSRLQRGSVVLFGSFVAGRFALDTVFVVRDWIVYRRGEAVDRLSEHVPHGYRETVLPTLRRWRKGEERCGAGVGKWPLRLHIGATIENQINGMYSWFPCQPAHECPNGFARPAIQIPNIVTSNLKMGMRLNAGTSEERVQDLWTAVVNRVESAGLWLGTHAEMPKRST